MESSTRIPLNL